MLISSPMSRIAALRRSAFLLAVLPTVLPIFLPTNFMALGSDETLPDILARLSRGFQ